jgi:hypothetical protein
LTAGLLDLGRCRSILGWKQLPNRRAFPRSRIRPPVHWIDCQFGLPQHAAEVRHLKLNEAVHLAISQNRALKIARLKVIENEQKKAGGTLRVFSDLEQPIESESHHGPAEYRDSGGAFGAVGGTLIPSQSVSLLQRQQTFERGA